MKEEAGEAEEEGLTFRQISRGAMLGSYGSFERQPSLPPPPPFTPATFSRLLGRDSTDESHHFEVKELLEREARQRSFLHRAFRGFFESKRYRRDRKWFLSLPWNTIRIVSLSTLFFLAFAFFVQQPAPDTGRMQEPPTNIIALAANQPFMTELETTPPNTYRVKLYFTMPTLHNTSFSQFPSRLSVSFSLQGLGGDANGSATWATLESYEAGVSGEEGEQQSYTFVVSPEARAAYEALRLEVSTGSPQPLALQFQAIPTGWLGSHEVAFGVLILVAVYILIVFELVHRAIAALVGSFWAVVFISVVEQRPSFDEVVSWIDFETIVFLFGMMTLIGVFSETGFFEWSAIQAYKLSGGNIWTLVLILVVFTGVSSSLLDNVTEVLLVVPITLRICKVIDVDPLPVIVAIVVFSNIGGTATGIGDPPNILIISNNQIQTSGHVGFSTFTLHMAPGTLLTFAVTLYYFYRKYYNLFQRSYVDPVAKEIEIWQRTANRLEPAATTDEEKRVLQQLLDYIELLRKHLEEKSKIKEENQKLRSSRLANSSALIIEADGEGEEISETELDISQLEKKYRIRNGPLFVKSAVVLGMVVLLFFLQPFIPSINLTISWIAILGALLLLTLNDVKELEPILARIEMGTLFFFAGLFVLMQCLENLGVMLYFARAAADVISIFPEGRIRLCLAVTLIMWVSAIASAFIDNIPFTTTMIPVVVELADSDLGLPLQPLVWAVAFGVCLGGNGTLVGASANVVAAGIAEQHGCHISFSQFFMIGFPCMIVSTATATCYLILTHVLIPWYTV